MLKSLEASHFAQLQGHWHAFEMPDGNMLELRVDSVTLRPMSRPPESHSSAEKDQGRMPFTVTLTSAPTQFVEGLCAVELPGIGRVENIMMSRQASLGRNPQHAYFQIMFN